MGCCMSTTRKPDPNRTRPRTPPAARSATEPPPEEEETVVKEVLSETPTPKPPIPYPTRYLARIREEDKEKPVAEIRNGIPPENADVSEASDICSLSESVSTVAEKPLEEDYSGEVRQMVGRSPAKMRSRSLSGEMRDKRVPVRNMGPGPNRVGLVHGKERTPMKRESGETSGRRSKSPATRSGSGLVPNPSARKAGKSPGRVGPDGPTRRNEESSKWLAPTAGDESLENPLVSLECFIFL